MLVCILNLDTHFINLVRLDEAICIHSKFNRGREGKEIRKDPEAKRFCVYFNNHYAGEAIENALELKEMIEEGKLTPQEREARRRVSQALVSGESQKTLDA